MSVYPGEYGDQIERNFARFLSVQAYTSGTTPPTGGWVDLRGLVSARYETSTDAQDETTHDSGPRTDQSVRSKNITISGGYRVRTDADARDPGQLILEAAFPAGALPGLLWVRYWENFAAGECWGARAQPSVLNASGDGKTDAYDKSFTLLVQSTPVDLTSPYGTAQGPVITSVTPSTGLDTAGGEMLTIRGNHFTGATGVAVGGTAATLVTVTSDSQIVCVSPAKTAGTHAVTVTTGVGTSAGFSVTYA